MHIFTRFIFTFVALFGSVATFGAEKDFSQMPIAIPTEYDMSNLWNFANDAPNFDALLKIMNSPKFYGWLNGATHAPTSIALNDLASSVILVYAKRTSGDVEMSARVRELYLPMSQTIMAKGSYVAVEQSLQALEKMGLSEAEQFVLAVEAYNEMKRDPPAKKSKSHHGAEEMGVPEVALEDFIEMRARELSKVSVAYLEQKKYSGKNRPGYFNRVPPVVEQQQSLQASISSLMCRRLFSL